MTGGIKIAKEINSSSNGDIPYANSDLVLDDITNLKNYKTYMGALQWGTDNWKAILSVRHRNGSGDGPEFGFYFMTDLTKIGNLIWRKQVGKTTWDSERTLLDSVNYSGYSLPLDGGSMTGPLTFANNTWNLMGDDCYIGDRNISGTICLKGKNGQTTVRLYKNDDESKCGDISFDGNRLSFSVPFGDLTHHTLGVTLPDSTTDNGWSMIAGNYYGYILRSIRTNQYAPSWIIGDYSAGICFGGSDTKGVISCAYPAPRIRFAGGNGTGPKWWCQLTGTSGTNITLPSFSTKVVGTEDDDVLSVRAGAISTWDSNNGSYRNGTIMFCW